VNFESALNELQKYPEDQRRDYVLSILRESGKRSLFILAKYILGYSGVKRRTHNTVIDCLQSESRRKLLCLPRGSFKSTLAVISYSVFSLLRNPNIRILIDSELYTNSSNFLREIKHHLESDLFVALYGNLKSSSTWNDSEIIVSTRNVHRKEATITCSGIGAGKTGQHYDLIIGDDYNSIKNSYSPENRQKVIDHYRLNQSILEPQGEYVVIGTRYADDDLIGWILKNQVAEVKETALSF
jgi:hypothetical protein